MQISRSNLLSNDLVSSAEARLKYLSNVSEGFYVKRIQPSQGHLDSHPLLLASVLLLVAWYTIDWIQRSKLLGTRVGYRSWWEPTWILRLRFVAGARSIVTKGYKESKDAMFRICRNDTDILIISNKYVNELRTLPDETATAIGAHIKVFSDLSYQSHLVSSA